VTAGAGRPVDARKVLSASLYSLCLGAVHGPLTMLVGLRVFNAPDMKELPGGLVLVSNHQSFLDPALIAVAANGRINFLARRSLFRVPGFGALIAALGAHPIRRGRVAPAALKAVIRVLRGGGKLLMFPEGTRTSDGELGPFRPGAAGVAMRCGTHVLPVCIEGAFESWPRTRALPRPARVAVAFGRPLPPRGGSAGELTAQMRAQIEELQSFLRGVLRRR